MDASIWREPFKAGDPVVERKVGVVNKMAHLLSRTWSCAADKYPDLINFKILAPDTLLNLMENIFTECAVDNQVVAKVVEKCILE